MDAGVTDACIVPESPPAIGSCSLDAANADVRGRTPLGAVSLTHAWSGALEGSCGTSSLALSAEPFLRGFGAFPTTRFPALDVSFLPIEGAGTFEVTVAVADGCERYDAIGTVTLTRNDYPGDDPRGASPRIDDLCACDEEWMRRLERTCEGAPTRPEIHGTLTVEAPGWSLEGRFVAPHCHLLHGICI